ncbi:MAG: hypothetical protein ACKVP4_07625 [Hyphomicrobium sp.]
MRRLFFALVTLAGAAASATAQAQPAPPAPAGEAKANANPCREEVANALQKLRKSSWFRMTTTMITEQGPTAMEVDYVLPDRMHQKVEIKLANHKSEMILVGNEGWSRTGEEDWKPLPEATVTDLRTQMQQSVVDQQVDVGNYSCKGRTTFDGRDVLSYKLEDEPAKDSTAPKNETFRMFYVDPTTGLPVSNALIAPGRETKPLFKASYAFPLDMKIEPPRAVAKP